MLAKARMLILFELKTFGNRLVEKLYDLAVHLFAVIRHERTLQINSNIDF